eukprot:6925468-Ditylum_brightwellii.AAC.1
MADKLAKNPAKPDVVPSSNDKVKRGGPVRSGRFQGSCDELKGHVFNNTDPRAADRFEIVKDEIARHVAVSMPYGTELKKAIKNMSEVDVTKPTPPTEDEE